MRHAQQSAFHRINTLCDALDWCRSFNCFKTASSRKSPCLELHRPCYFRYITGARSTCLQVCETFRARKHNNTPYDVRAFDHCSQFLYRYTCTILGGTKPNGCMICLDRAEVIPLEYVYTKVCCTRHTRAGASHIVHLAALQQYPPTLCFYLTSDFSLFH